MTRYSLTAYVLFLLAVVQLPLAAGTSRRHGAAYPPGFPIENFDSGSITLTSYQGEDQQPNGWTLDSLTTHNSSPFALRLTGNTWKVEAIPPRALDSGTVWNVTALLQQTGELQGFGVRDSAHEILFAFHGTEQADPAIWVTVYQGAFSTGAWSEYRLPVADEWLARFGYVPVITSLIFINDRDSDPTSVILFDDIEDITADLPSPPQVSISFAAGRMYRARTGALSVDVQFTSHVTDPDGGPHRYLWTFGDGVTSTDANPQHTFLVADDHAYRVLLDVADTTQLHGRATCLVAVDPGPTTFPLTMTFVGDVMLARAYEAPGGIIPTRGVNAIFAPTRSVLGDSADLTVANLECPLTTSGTPHPTKPIVFRGAPSNAAGLVSAGIDVVTLANNHIIDYGLAGLRETQSTLEQRGIAFSGAGGNAAEACEPLFVSRSGVTFGFVAFSDRTGQYNNYQPYLDAGENKPGFANLTLFELTRRINEARPNADILVAEMHSGTEYATEPVLSAEPAGGDEDYAPGARAPLATDREIRRAALDAGADLVVCHHPHITQGFEVYNGKLIAHSLGNFAFDLTYAETFPSVILRAEVGASGLTGYTLIPVYIDDFIPLRATGDLACFVLDDLAMKSRELGATVVVDRTSATARILLDTLALIPHAVRHTMSVPLHQSGAYRISRPIRLPRNGSLSAVSGVLPAGSWSVRTGRELLWMGNFENEGCSLWDLASSDEVLDSTAHHAGMRALRQRRTQGAGTLTTSLERRLPTGGGLAFSLCGWLSGSNAGTTTAGVRFYPSRSGAETGSGDIGTTLQGTTPWTFCSNDLTAPAGTAFIDVEMRSAGPASGTGVAWFDDAGVIEWSDWETPGRTLPAPNDSYWIQVRTSSAVTTATVAFEELQYVDPQTPARIDVAVTAGWNLISRPVLLPDSASLVRSLFPTSLFEYAFGFSPDSGYIESDILRGGSGYWAKFPDARTVSIAGTRCYDETLRVAEGWNIIGSISGPVDTASLRTIPPGLLQSVVFGYGSGYVPAEQILPGGAYWVKCSGPGTILLSGSAPAARGQHRRGASETLATMTVTDAAGHAGTLFLRSGEESPRRFEPPPPPPDEPFTVQFESGLIAAWAAAETTSVQGIAVSSAAYPMTIRWSAAAGTGKAGLRTSQGIFWMDHAGSLTLPRPDAQLALLTGTIGAETPSVFALDQNYPNPFNPSTAFRYAVPVRGNVSLGIYSVTGQLVRTLESGERDAGSHTVFWNGTNDAGMRVGSGVYIARLTAGTYHQTRKVLLLK